MSYALDALIRRKKELEELLEKLRKERDEVKAKLDKVKAKEDELYKKLIRTRDPIEASRTEILMQKVSEIRRLEESKLESLERKIRGAEHELEDVKRRIEILKPRTVKWVVEYEAKKS